MVGKMERLGAQARSQTMLTGRYLQLVFAQTVQLSHLKYNQYLSTGNYTLIAYLKLITHTYLYETKISFYIFQSKFSKGATTNSIVVF